MRKRHAHPNSSGFTLIELLVSISIASLLLGFITFNLLHAQQHASVSSVLDMIASDLRGQQLKAMNGTVMGGNKAPWGIHFESDSYTTFSGTSYNIGDSTNYVEKMDSNIQLLPSPTQEIIFSERSGESGEAMTVTVRSTVDNQQKTLYLNSLGVITSVH